MLDQVETEKRAGLKTEREQLRACCFAEREIK